MNVFSNANRPSLSLALSTLNPRQVLIGVVFLLMLSISSYAILCLDPLIGFSAFLAAGFFILCFLNMGIGFALFLASILFSPDIDLRISMAGTLRITSVRFEDMLSVSLALGWVARLAILREFRLIRLTPLNLPISIFLSICVVSTFRGMAMGWVDPSTGILFTMKYAQYLLIFFLVSSYVRTYEQIARLLKVWFFFVFLFCLYAYWQIPRVEQWGFRLAAPFAQSQESTSLGGILAFSMAVGISILLYTQSKLVRYWLVVGLLFVFFPFLYTLSRTSYAAFLFMVLVIAAYNRNRFLILSILLVVSLAPILLPQVVLDRIAYTWEGARAMGVDTSTQERIMVYRKIWGTIRSSPLQALLGHGVSAFDIMDSQYVRTMVETGLIGLGCLLTIFFAIYRTARHIYRNTRLAWMKGLSLGYISGFLGLLVHSLAANTFTMIRTMEMFWFVTALIFVYAAIMEKIEPEILAKRPGLALR